MAFPTSTKYKNSNLAYTFSNKNDKSYDIFNMIIAKKAVNT